MTEKARAPDRAPPTHPGALRGPGWTDVLFGDPEVAAILSPERQLADMLRIEAAFARAAGAEAAARAIAATRIDRAALASAAARDGVPVPELVRQLRAQAPEAVRAAIHTGLTSQDVIDTALVLALRDLFDLFEARLAATADALGALGERLGGLRMTGVTRSQPALPVTFAARLAGWLAPFPDHFDRLEALRPLVLRLQFGGPVGDRPRDAVAVAMAAELGLAAPERAWHADRTALAEATGWMALIAGHLGKIGQDIATMALMGDIRVEGGGGSSAMPHKENPVQAELLIALARDAAHQQGAMLAALPHGMERDGAAWMAEWLALPRIAGACGRALAVAPGLLAALTPPGGADGPV
jgi:3-carboxy-cis,cis-muconate cycloisomerase